MIILNILKVLIELKFTMFSVWKFLIPGRDENNIRIENFLVAEDWASRLLLRKSFAIYRGRRSACGQGRRKKKVMLIRRKLA